MTKIQYAYRFDILAEELLEDSNNEVGKNRYYDIEQGK